MEDQNNTNPEEENGAANNADNISNESSETQSTGGVEPVKRAESVSAPVGGAYTQDASAMFSTGLNLGFINQKVTACRSEIAKFVIGQQDMVDLLMISIFSNGHVLLEGVPGVAKTLTAKVLSKTLSVDFSRIQFTPDLMPSDVIGTSVFNLQNSEFTFKKFPVGTF